VALVVLDERLQNVMARGKLRIQQRTILLRSRQKDELPVHAIGVDILRVFQLIADLRCKTGNIDHEIIQLGAFPGQSLQGHVVPLHHGGRVDLEQIAVNQPVLEKAHHGVVGLQLVGLEIIAWLLPDNGILSLNRNLGSIGA